MPKPPDLTEFNLRTGVLLSKDKGVLLAGHKTLDEENTAHTFQFVWRANGEWSGKRQVWTSGAVHRGGPSNSSAVTVGEDGKFHLWDDVHDYEGTISDGGIFRSVRSIKNSVYAVGMSALIFSMDRDGKWKEINFNISRDKSFEAVDGYSENDLYLVGWDGLICHCAQNKCNFEQSLTNVILTDVCCSPDGYVYCCGQQGIIIRGRDDEWEVMCRDEITEDFWAVTCFRGYIYLSTASFLYILDNGQLKRVKFGLDIPKTFYHLSAFGDDLLWSIGPSDLMAFDGEAWKRIL
jgi:hypothetical protein